MINKSTPDYKLNSDSESEIDFNASELKNISDYDEVLDQVNNSSDLLRNNETKLRFRILHLIYILIGLSVATEIQKN